MCVKAVWNNLKMKIWKCWSCYWGKGSLIIESLFLQNNGEIKQAPQRTAAKIWSDHMNTVLCVVYIIVKYSNNYYWCFLSQIILKIIDGVSNNNGETQWTC